MAKKIDVSERVIEAAFKLAAERGWRGLSLAEIAEAAKLPLSQVYPLFPTKEAILRAFSRRIDAEVLGDQSLVEEWDDDGSARDRLFDVMMRRFDALAPYKTAIGHLLHERSRDPLGALCGLRSCATPWPPCWRWPACRPRGPAMPFDSRAWRRFTWPRSGSGYATSRVTWPRPWPRSTAICGVSRG